MKNKSILFGIFALIGLFGIVMSMTAVSAYDWCPIGKFVNSCYGLSQSVCGQYYSAYTVWPTYTYKTCNWLSGMGGVCTNGMGLYAQYCDITCEDYVAITGSCVQGSAYGCNYHTVDHTCQLKCPVDSYTVWSDSANDCVNVWTHFANFFHTTEEFDVYLCDPDGYPGGIQYKLTSGGAFIPKDDAQPSGFPSVIDPDYSCVGTGVVRISRQVKTESYTSFHVTGCSTTSGVTTATNTDNQQQVSYTNGCLESGLRVGYTCSEDHIKATVVADSSCG